MTREVAELKLSNSYLSIKTTADIDIIDITPYVSSTVAQSGLTEGHVLVFVPGSTAAVTTIEYESGVVQDLRDAIERLAPEEYPIGMMPNGVTGMAMPMWEPHSSVPL